MLSLHVPFLYVLSGRTEAYPAPHVSVSSSDTHQADTEMRIPHLIAVTLTRLPETEAVAYGSPPDIWLDYRRFLRGK
ncbi:hypothetical protein T265_01348 [Opisthorchis viverrini]|uniref:Uncharacterized protein n=1 Tax=Opisthorchis viverrini TaxID=6198 RepID=A0A075AJ29_OPIVI|nr:hypothetical protein T265_01348 [Opisthorchis viverrini]KER32664.1 hypothetical protein T265_01348 [Opisthorchis viverrini]